MSPEKLSEGTFGVSLSSSEGGFTLSGGLKADDPVTPDPENVAGISSSSSGCDMGLASFIMLSMSAVFILRSKNR